MKKVYGIVGALALLAGCSQSAQEDPEQVGPVDEPAAAEETTAPEPSGTSEIDQYLHDVRNKIEFGNLVLREAPFADTSDSDLLRAGYAFCDYVEQFDEDTNYRLAVTMTSVMEFPESVSDADDGGNYKLAAAAAANLCPDHAAPMSEWMENFEG